MLLLCAAKLSSDLISVVVLKMEQSFVGRKHDWPQCSRFYVKNNAKIVDELVSCRRNFYPYNMTGPFGFFFFLPSAFR